MCRTRMQIDLIDALRRVLAVHELQITPLVEPFDQLHRFDYGLRDALDPQFDWKLMGRTLLESTPERALLLMEGTFGMRYFIFRMPDEQDKAYIIGPWRSAASREQLQKNLEWFGVRTSQQMRDLVENFYSGIYLMEDESLFGQTVLSLLSAAFPHVDGREDFHIEMRKELLPFNFTAVDLGETHLEASAGLSRTMLEERYNNESDLMDAVAQGDIEKAMKIVERHRRFRYSDDRFFNDLQELRNSLIVLNVLLRKSIQRAEVHPCYIDTLSAGYYQRIRTVTVEQGPGAAGRDACGLLPLCAGVCAAQLFALDPQCDQLYQSEPGGIAVPAGAGRAVLYQPELPVQPVPQRGRGDAGGVHQLQPDEAGCWDADRVQPFHYSHCRKSGHL